MSAVHEFERAAREVTAQIAALGAALERAAAPLTLEAAVAATGLSARTVMRRIEDLREAGVAVLGYRLGAGRTGWALPGSAAAEGAAPVQAGETRATMAVPETGA